MSPRGTASEQEYRSKRLLDIIVSLSLLPLLLPVLTVSLLLVFLLDGPPVLFHQERIGRSRSRLTVTKVRTMPLGSHVHHREGITQLENPTEDFFLPRSKRPKPSRLGKALRRVSVDEIPQVFSVLAGEMSLVGPRPILPEELDHVPERFRARFDAKPGLTGLWQVSGRKLTTSTTALELDCKYVAESSIWFDIKILLKTPLAMINGAGAE